MRGYVEMFVCVGGGGVAASESKIHWWEVWPCQMPLVVPEALHAEDGPQHSDGRTVVQARNFDGRLATDV